MTQGAFIAFGLACVSLGFYAAWILRGRDVLSLERSNIKLRRDSATARADADLAEKASDGWQDRAIAAEKELAKLPKRVAHGQFGRRT